MRPYAGRVDIKPQILHSWIPRHLSFASKDWIIQAIKYERWHYHDRTRFRFSVYPIVFEKAVGRKIRVELRANHYTRGTKHVVVDYAHVL